MVTSTTGHGHELPQKCPKMIKENEEKLFSKLFSKENNSSSIMTTTTTTTNNNNMNSSFRVYYGGSASAAIPFMWESAPGTPKHSFSTSSLPPLTPPPSYQGYNSRNSSTKPSSSSPSPSMRKHYSRQYNLLYTIFPRLLSRKKTHVSSPLSLSSSSSYSISSSPSYSSSSSCNSVNPNIRGRYFVSRPKSPIYFGFDYDQEEYVKAVGSSPTSTLYFVGKRGTGLDDGFRGCFRWLK